MKKIGFIGLGIMGKPMAKNLVKGGVDLLVYDLNKDAMDELVSLGATKANTLEEIGENCDIIFTILPNGKIVENVITGENGVISKLKPKGLIVDMSSVSPVETNRLCDILSQKNIDLLDAPVSGGEPKAISGDLSFMVGGKEEAFSKAKKYFDIMGASAILVGGSGSGSTTKLANQIIVNLNIAAMSEALVLGTKAGVDPEKLYLAIRGGLAGSNVLDAKAPLVISRNFKAGGRIDINLKDIKNVMATGEVLDTPLPLTTKLLGILEHLNANGHHEDDHGGIVQYYEEIANTKVQKIQ